MSYAGDITPEEAWKLLARTPRPCSSTSAPTPNGASSGCPTCRASAARSSTSSGTPRRQPATSGFVEDLVAAGVRAGRAAGGVPVPLRATARSAPPRRRPRRASPVLQRAGRVRGRPRRARHRGAHRLEGRRPALGAVDEPPVPSVRARRTARRRQPGHHRCARRPAAVRLRRDRRGDVPDVGLRLRGAPRPRRRSPARSTATSTRRYGNPTISMFEERLRLIEGAPACFATATGMAAVFTSLARCWPRATGWSRRAPVRLVLRGVQRDPAALGCGDGVRRRRRPRSGERRCRCPRRRCSSRRRPTRCSRWSTSRAVCELAHAAGAKVVLDNVFATPMLQQGLPLGADVVVYSGTKHIDGQGRVLGGAILGRGVHRRAGAEADAPHRPGAQPVQRVDAAEGPGDAGGAGRAAERVGAADRGVPRGASRGRAGCATRSWSRIRSTTWPSGR